MAINETQILVLAEQHPGQVSFKNYEEVRSLLSIGLQEFKDITYLPNQLPDAKADLKTLKAVKKKISDKKKELKAAYSAP